MILFLVLLCAAIAAARIWYEQERDRKGPFTYNHPLDATPHTAKGGTDMNGCIYRTEENKCKQFSVGGVLSFCYLDGTCDCQIPSNADRIRAMSDEELADFLLHICDWNWRDWLKAPVEEVDE